MASEQLLTEHAELWAAVRMHFQEAFKEHFRGVVLYGSEALGEAHEDSDMNLVVLVTGPIQLRKDIYTAVSAVYDLQLKLDRLIHVRPINIEVFRAGEYRLLPDPQERGDTCMNGAREFWARAL